MRLTATIVPLVCSTLLLSCPGFADEKPKPDKQKEAAKNQTDQESKAEQKEEQPKPPPVVTLTGIFEGVQASELTAGTEEITSLKIKKIIDHGAAVREGQTLVSFETEDIDEKIEAAEHSLRLAKIDLADAEFDSEQFRKSQALDRAAAERNRKAARQTHDNYVQYGLDRSIDSAEFNLKSYQASYDNAFEELKQLEQMYKEDELTEESEEIVLKRAQQSVDSAQFRLEGAKVDIQRTLKQSIPRQTAQQNDAFARAEMAFEKAVRSLDVARQKHELEMKQKREKFQDDADDLAASKAERAKLVITAPHDGIAYHGELTRGKLSDKPSSLKEGSAATNKLVLVTVINPNRLQIRTELTETLLSKVRTGMSGTATASAIVKRTLPVRVKAAKAIPFANNKFDCVLTIGKGNLKGIVPGMSCSVKLPEEKSAEANAKAKKKR